MRPRLFLSLGDRSIGPGGSGVVIGYNDRSARIVPVEHRGQRRRFRVPDIDRPSAPPSEEPSERRNEVTTGEPSTPPSSPPPSSGFERDRPGAGPGAAAASPYGL